MARRTRLGVREDACSVRGSGVGHSYADRSVEPPFKIMAIDIQTIRDSKIAKTYHLENWLSALGQLRAK